MSESLSLDKAPGTIALERLLWLGGRLLHLIPADCALTVPCGINRGLRWLRGAANAPEWIGIYEFRKQRALRRLVAPGMTVCDIGANAGFYTLGLARLVGACGQVIAFEPLPRNLAKIQRHLALNHLTNVDLNDCALSDLTDTLRFAKGENDFTGRISAEGADLEVRSIRLDEFLRERSLPDPALLKIDVEGAEDRVLEGARELLRRAHPILVLALHGAAQKARCFEILRSLGYRIQGLSGKSITAAAAMPEEVIAVYSHSDAMRL
jgi:FkbM family methyltransferase